MRRHSSSKLCRICVIGDAGRYCCTSRLTCRSKCCVTSPPSLDPAHPAPPPISQCFWGSWWLISETACNELEDSCKDSKQELVDSSWSKSPLINALSFNVWCNEWYVTNSNNLRNELLLILFLQQCVYCFPSLFLGSLLSSCCTALFPWKCTISLDWQTEKQTNRILKNILKLQTAVGVFITKVLLFEKLIKEINHCYCRVPVNMKLLICFDFPLQSRRVKDEPKDVS